MTSSSVGQGRTMDIQAPQFGTMTASTNTGQGSGPLSNPYIAVMVNEGLRGGKDWQVVVPEGSSQMSVHCSACIASFRVRSIQLATPDLTIVVAPPGKKQVVGYAYKVLQPVIKETTSVPSYSGKSTGPPGNARTPLHPR